MTTNYILIDFENVQPDKLGALDRKAFKIKIFVGARQSRVALGMASALQPMGEAVEYIQIEGSGRNALDLHIAFYMGRLAVQEPGSVFHIVSKDTDYDPLIDHLRKLGIKCDRSSAFADIAQLSRAKPAVSAVSVAAQPARPKASAKRAPRTPAKAAAAAPAAPEPLDEVVKNLLKRRGAVPATLDKLASTIKSVFTGRITDKAAGDLIEQLRQRGLIAIADGKVTYHLGKK